MPNRSQHFNVDAGDGVPPLTDEEISYARELIQQDRNQKYVVRMLKAHAPWVFVIVGSIVSGLYWVLTHVSVVRGP